jgi:hypothetical protein
MQNPSRRRKLTPWRCQRGHLGDQGSRNKSITAKHPHHIKRLSLQTKENLIPLILSLISLELNQILVAVSNAVVRVTWPVTAELTIIWLRCTRSSRNSKASSARCTPWTLHLWRKLTSKTTWCTYNRSSQHLPRPRRDPRVRYARPKFTATWLCWTALLRTRSFGIQSTLIFPDKRPKPSRRVT